MGKPFICKKCRHRKEKLIAVPIPGMQYGVSIRVCCAKCKTPI